MEFLGWWTAAELMSHSARIVNPSYSCLLDSGSSLTDIQVAAGRSSITEHTPLVVRCLSERQISFYPQDLYIFTDPQLSVVIQESEAAILQGVYPQRITKGSSGSYFVISLTGVCFSSLNTGICTVSYQSDGFCL